MSHSRILKRMLRVATLAAMFATASAYAQSAQDATGKTKENQASKMSTTGQNETSSASTPSPAATNSGTASSGSSSTAKESGKSMSRADQRVMQDFAQANLAEIQAGKVALGKTQNQEVKTFAQKMIDDHTQALQELQQVAQAKGVTLPTEPDRKHQAMLKKLEGMSGDAFDRSYMAQGGLADHRNAHRLLQQAQSRAVDPDLKSLVSKTLPVVDQHLSMAQQLQAGISGKGTSGTTGSTGTSSGSSGTSGKGGATGTGGMTSPGTSGTGGTTSGQETPGTSGPGSSGTGGSSGSGK